MTIAADHTPFGLHDEVSDAEMSRIFAEQGRTRAAYIEHVAAGNPAKDEAQREKNRFWTDTKEPKQ